MEKRACGILLHISSLPSEYGIGDFGAKAYEFADFLKDSRQTHWQVLPINQIDSIGNYSPYDCLSAFAGNVLFISPERLVEDGLLSRKDCRDRPVFSKTKVNFRLIQAYKIKVLDAAFKNFKKNAPSKSYKTFCTSNKDWLDDYSVFVALRNKFKNRPWCKWPQGLRDKNPDSLNLIEEQLTDGAEKEKFQQYIFFKQWTNLKNYCNKIGISIIGDIPIYVSKESADVWGNPEIFKLTKQKQPSFIAGVPPDHYSKTGQLWGNPVYNWETLKKTGYQWWMRRIKHNLTLFDMVRIDHFRGFAAYWQVPAGSKTAVCGRWIKGPGEDFLGKIFKQFASSRFIAEDLGYITADVRDLIKKYELTSMKVLMFGFDDKKGTKNSHYPDNYTYNCVVYTGTHDNNTVKGWYRNEASLRQKEMIYKYIGRTIKTSDINWELIKIAMKSLCRIAVIPMQDVLGLGQQGRMNKPSTKVNNWQWRLVLQNLKNASKKLTETTLESKRV